MRRTYPPIIPIGTPMWQRYLGVVGLVLMTPVMMALIGVLWLIEVLKELTEAPPPPQARRVQETKTEHV